MTGIIAAVGSESSIRRHNRRQEQLTSNGESSSLSMSGLGDTCTRLSSSRSLSGEQAMVHAISKELSLRGD